MQESGLLESIPLMCTLAIWGQYPVVSHPDSPQGTALGAAAMAEGVAARSFVSILSSLRAHHQGSCSGLMAATSFVY